MYILSCEKTRFLCNYLFYDLKINNYCSNSTLVYTFKMTTKISLKNLSDRLNYALSLTGTKKADLARSIAVKPQVIQFLCTSKTQSSRFTFEIATALGLNIRWLATGEGEIFIENDPHYNLTKTCKFVPILNMENIRKFFLYNETINQLKINEWLPLKSDEEDIIAIEMADTSMEPKFPFGSYLFLKKYNEASQRSHKFILAYLYKFNTFIVRELTNTNSQKLLTPSNIELFKEIVITDDTLLLAGITHCFWHMRN